MEFILSIGMTVPGTIRICSMLTPIWKVTPADIPTAANTTTQSSHHSLLATRLLDMNLKSMMGKVTAAMIAMSRIISALRDG